MYHEGEQILQIITAPPGIWAVYALHDGTVCTSPVVCLALVQTAEGHQEIRCVPFSSEAGCEDPLYLADNVVGYDLMRVPEEDPFWCKVARDHNEADARARERRRQREQAAKAR